MTISRADVLSKARVHLADSTGNSPFWEDADIYVYADCAISEILPLLPKTYAPHHNLVGVADIVAGQSSYELSGFTPSLASVIHTIDTIYYDGIKCRLRSLDDITDLERSTLLMPTFDDPVAYRTEDSIVIKPTPTAAATGGLRLNYVALPAKFSAGVTTISLEASLLDGLAMITAGLAKVSKESAAEGKELITQGYESLSRTVGKSLELKED